MKVRVCDTVEIDTEVTVTVEDIQAAILEAVEDAKEGEGRFVVHAVINTIYRALNGIDDSMIERCSLECRSLFADAL